ncbi:MAG TPA: hypothetical protein VGD36_13455 [Xanthobacteraceae bacterium]|jgi:hypothetical protein
MTHHHHAPDHHHPPQFSAAPSLLRFSAVERLALAGLVIAILWGALLWAMA